jgi:hypothetical protein
MFRAATLGGSRRSDQWHAARLPKASIATHVGLYGMSLKWLSEHMENWENSPPAKRWTQDVLNAMIDDIAPAYATATVIARVRSLKKMLSMIAPEANLTHFDVVISQLGRIGPAVNPLVHRVSSDDLFRCGQKLMCDAERESNLALEQRALVFQTGFQIALLSRRPWRSSAFCAIEIVRHLISVCAGWRLVAGSDESARKRSSSSPVPAPLIVPLERLIQHWRPILRPRAVGWPHLWTRPEGLPFSSSHLHYYVSHATNDHFKFAISPKWFRKILSTTVARYHPEIVHVTATVLGHGHRVDERYYNLAGSVEAYRDLSDCIDAIGRSRP